MTTTRWSVALLAATAMTAITAAPANAETKKEAAAKHRAHHGRHATKRPRAAAAGPALGAVVAAQQRQIEALSAEVQALRAAPAPVAPAPVVDDEAVANTEFLKAQVDALQAQVDSVKKLTAANAPAWKGTPEWSGDGGFKFKMNGEIQYDAGYVSNPGNRINTPNLGINNRSRRLLLGIEGALPGDFTYKAQFDFAQGGVAYEDVVLEFAPKGTPFTFSVGNFYPFSSLDNMTSNRFVSVLERSQLNDAFGNGRRIGAAGTYVNKTGDFRIQAGAFFNNSINATFANNGYQLSGRVVFSPQIAGGQAHLGGSYQHRRFATNALGLAYGVRPFVQTTDQRFVNTSVAGKGDDIFGVEGIYIHGPFHVQGEAQYLKVDGLRPGAILPGGQTIVGSLTGKNPSFFSAYGELGFWLTGETRGYKNGKIDRTKILNPVNAGGLGGLQLIGRVDYIDLNEVVNPVTAINNGKLTGGGQQTGYIVALNYWPIDYVRFSAQYTRSEIKGGPFATAVVPVSTLFSSEREYGADIFALRAQIDF